MPSPQYQFISIPELLASVGQFIQNRKLLYDLCLTSKAFHAVFAPFLYSEVWFNHKNEYQLIEYKDRLLQNEAWKYTKTLDFDICSKPEGQYPPTHNKFFLCRRYNGGVAALLKRMPRLTKLL